MRTRNKEPARALLPAIVAATCVLAAAIAGRRIADLARGTPHMGDIIAFAPSDDRPADEDIRLLVQRPNQYGCVLDLDILRRSGGSLVVETDISGDAKDFRVHWAGARTSADTGNCGSDAELILDHQDLDTLALSAGGYGLDPTMSPVLTGGIGE